MSFYLIPAGSFQSQQKLKKKASDRKNERENRSHSRLSSTNSTYSGISLQSLEEKSIVTNESSIHEPIISKSILSTKVKSPSVFANRKTELGSFNYTAITDMKEVLEFTKKRQRKHSSSGSSIHRSTSHLTSSFETLSLEKKEVKIDFKPVEYQSSESQKIETSNNESGQPIYWSGEISNQYDQEPVLYDSLEEDLVLGSTQELTPVYSNVSSVFSTKKLAPNLIPSTVSAVSSKARAKSSFFGKAK